MEEVTESALPTWLVNARRGGYTLVGLEQTAESVSLLDFQWPERTVLVLGRWVVFPLHYLAIFSVFCCS